MNSKVKHIYWFSHYGIIGASTRYRGWYPLKYLEHNHNVRVSFVYPSKKVKVLFSFVSIYLSAICASNKNSVVVIQKVCSNRIYANLLKLLVKFKSENVIYDIDDAEYLRQDPKTLNFFLKNARAVSVGSSALEEYCRGFNTNIKLLTSPVRSHNALKAIRNKKTHIGWVGDLGNGNPKFAEFSHKTALFNIFFPSLLELDRSIKLTLLGVNNEMDRNEIFEYFKDFRNIELWIPMNCDWENDSWVYDKIKNFDVGISPLTDHPFNASKSAFKVKQYLSVGVPTIGSSIGENAKFICNSLNGFLCSNKWCFTSALERIIDMEDDEYFRFSRNALKSHSSFSMDKYCQELIELSDSILDSE